MSQSSILQQAEKLFRSKFNESANIAVSAPGRVNLIGEHTDYNDGFVLPMAIDMRTFIVGRKTSGNRVRVASTMSNTKVESFDASASLNPASGDASWTNYVLGVFAEYAKDFKDWQFGCDIAVASNVPGGSGLSSSAALEVAVATFIEAINGSVANTQQAKVERAKRCQRAERNYANVPCGIMDQYISSCAVADNAMLIDCRSFDNTLAPIQDPQMTVLIINCNRSHSLGDGAYRKRVESCERVVQALKPVHAQIKALRDAKMTELESVKSELSTEDYRRARHVITENDRTHRAVDAASHNNFDQFGKYMVESHQSLRNDYEVSTEELDTLVELAVTQRGVKGARMTGGGFGGCIVALVAASHVDEVKAHVQREYKAKCGIECTPYVSKPAEGAKVEYQRNVSQASAGNSDPTSRHTEPAESGTSGNTSKCKAWMKTIGWTAVGLGLCAGIYFGVRRVLPGKPTVPAANESTVVSSGTSAAAMHTEVIIPTVRQYT